MSAISSLDDTLQLLKAAGEASRLRLLAVCAQGELTVGELCQVLKQSQPRVSRHLKLLCDAGLLLRFREEHCVYYRTPPQGDTAEAVKTLLGWLDAGDATLKQDRERAGKVRAKRAALAAQQLGHPADSDESLKGVLLGEIDGPVGNLLDIGTGTGRILQWLAGRAQQAVGVDLSTEALRVARTAVHGAGLSHCVLQRGDMYELPFAAQSFDTITMDRVLSGARQPSAALKEAARLLRPDGRLIAIEDYDALESVGGRNGLATLRGWLQAAELDCERLRPIETGAQHLILAVGRKRGRLDAAA